MMRNSRTRLTLFLVLAAPAILSPPAPAGAAPCLSHQAARDKYPDAHLYWHTDNRCWDDNRRGARHYDDPDPVSQDAKPSKSHDAKSELPVDQATSRVHTTVYFPALEVNAWPAAALPITAADMSRWPLLFDVDQPTKFERWRDRVTGSFK
jgi:hypothetical protein